MKKLFVIIITFGLILTGCNSNSETAQTPMPDDTQQVSKTEAPAITDIPENDNSLTLILMNSIVERNDEAMAEYMSALMAEEGFDLKVKFYRIDYRNRDKSLSEWRDMLREEFGKSQNVAVEFIYSLQELDAEGLLYYPSEKNYLSVGSRKGYNYTGVYINAELEEQFGMSISNITEYGQFLDWAKTNAPDKKPCMFLMDGGRGESYSPIALFAQENGFVRADQAIGGLTEGGHTFYMELSDIAAAKNGPPAIFEAANLPFFEQMDSMLDEWHQKGYMDIKHKSDEADFSKYASLVMNMEETTDYYSYDNTDSHWKLQDVSDFNLHVFTGGDVRPDSPLAVSFGASGRFAISANSPSVDTVMGFFDWIYKSTDNYLLFMCGKEGTDYTVKDDVVTFLPNEQGLVYGEWYKHTSFVEPDMNLVMPHFPVNWDAVRLELNEVENTDIRQVIGDYENSEALSKLIDETVFSDELRSSYRVDINTKYDKYFNEFKKETRAYTLENLRNGINQSGNLTRKKEAWENLIKFVCGE